MIFETDVTKLAYIAAWNRGDQDECVRLSRHQATRMVKSLCRDETDRDYAEEAEAHGVTVSELLGPRDV